MIRRPVIAVALFVLFSACRGGSAPAAPAPQPLTDANIAAIVLAADNADIGYANVALNRAQSAQVRAFAQTMINDHTGVNKAAADLAGKLNLTPVENSISLDMRDKAEEKRDALREATSFDAFYIDNEITYHEDLLKALDQLLIPGARNPELKDLLVKVRPAVVAHLGHARMIKTSLGR